MKPTPSPEREGPPPRTTRFARALLIAAGSLLFIGASLAASGNAAASHTRQAGVTATPQPGPTPTFDPGRLAKPQVPRLRSQADEGALIYWGICLACHGDRGQGLTDEWRFGAFGADANCWESGCHSKRHPLNGFEIPRDLVIPALSSAGALGRFENAQQLYEYVVVMMPWWKPRSLGSEKAWQATAYLIKMKGNLPEGLTLNETNASAMPVHRPITYPLGQEKPILFFIGVFTLAVLAFIARGSLPHPSAARPARPNFFAHLHPPTIPALQARWRYTLGAGGMAVFLSLILVVTGLLEMFYYVPTPEGAAISVETITTFVPFGALVRNLHYWSAQLLVGVALIHLARVVFTGAYGAPRRFNFLLGLGLLVFVILLDFTGYVLRWDEGIRWALTAGTNLLKSIPVIGTGLYVLIMGSDQPGAAALLRFYSWHIFVLSLAGGIVLIWHLFRVRRDGGIAAAPAPVRAERARITRFDLLRREVLAMLGGGLLLIALAASVPAPIAPPIRGDTILDADSSAPWFFLWVQQLLKWGDPFLLGVLLPLILLVGMASMPYLFAAAGPDELGRWFPRSGRTVQTLFTILCLALALLTLAGLIR
jgi:quinol-cytochrome oxidoreductase complex cytochrome b subunit